MTSLVWLHQCAGCNVCSADSAPWEKLRETVAPFVYFICDIGTENTLRTRLLCSRTVLLWGVYRASAHNSVLPKVWSRFSVNVFSCTKKLPSTRPTHLTSDRLPHHCALSKLDNLLQCSLGPQHTSLLSQRPTWLLLHLFQDRWMGYSRQK